jgi:hypothetical protein
MKTPTSEPRLTLKRFARISQIARLVLHGPRAVMFPEDPNGIRSWLEPVVWMKSYLAPLETSKSVVVFSTPNCLNRNSLNVVLIRYTQWESGIDRTLCKNGILDWPSIITTYKLLSSPQITLIDDLLRKVDESVAGFPFPVEGLDLSGASGFKPLPENATIVANAVHNELCRATRFCYIETHWTPMESNLSKLDESWRLLFETSINLVEDPDLPAPTSAMEKYDFDPRAYGEFLRPTSE